VLRHGFTDRESAEQVDVERVGTVRGDGEGVATPEDGELSGADGRALEADGAGAGERVGERVELDGPRKTEPRARRDRRVDDGDRGVCRTRTGVGTEGAGDETNETRCGCQSVPRGSPGA